MRIKKSCLRIYTGLFFILLFAFTTSMHQMLFGGLKNAIYILTISVFVVWDRRVNNTVHVKPVVILIFGMLFVMLANNRDAQQFGTYMVYDIMFYVIAWLMFALFYYTDDWHKAFCRLCLFFGMFHAAATWFFFFFPGIYLSKVTPLFGSWTATMVKEFTNGWAPGLSPTYSLNAIYLSIGACACMGSVIAEKKKIAQFIFILSALLLTGKRSQLISTVFVFVFVYYVYNSDKKLTRFFKLAAILIVSVLCFDIASQFVPQLANFINRFQQTAETGDVTLGRVDRYMRALQIFKEHPIFGIGWNGTSYYFRATDGLYINVHNIYIQLLTETGITGAVLYFLFFIRTLVISVKTVPVIKCSDAANGKAVIACGALGIQVFFLMYGFTGNPLYDAPALIPYVLSAAVMYYYRIKQKNVQKEKVSKKAKQY